MLQLEMTVVRAWQTDLPIVQNNVCLSEDVGISSFLHSHLTGFLYRAFHLQVFRRAE